MVADDAEESVSLRAGGYQNASILQLVTFGWVGPLIERANASGLEEHDADWLIPQSDYAQRLATLFDAAYSKVKGWKRHGPGNKTAWTLLLLYWPTLLMHSFWVAVEVGTRLLSPVILRSFLRWLAAYKSDNPDPEWQGWLIVIALGVAGFIMTILHHQLFWVGMRLGFTARQQVVAAIHAKALRLNSASISTISSGHVVNLVSNDVRRFDDATPFWCFLWAGPLELGMVLLMVSLDLGFLPALAGVAATLLLIPVQGILVQPVASIRRNTAQKTDERVRLAGEAIQGALAMKMLSWEQPVAAALCNIRGEEARYVTRMARIRACNMALQFAITPVVAFCTFAVYRARSGQLNVASVFYALSLLSLPRLYMVQFFVQGIQTCTELRVALQRIDKFLSTPEPPLPGHAASSRSSSSSDGSSHSGSSRRGKQALAGVVALLGADYDWKQPFGGQPTTSLSAIEAPPALKQDLKQQQQQQDQEDQEDLLLPAVTLSGVRFELQPGELLGVCGEVGSGKSSVLAALLGELQPLQPAGSLQPGNAGGGVVCGRVAYCSQIPWIVAGSVRDNIVFGSAFDEARYQRVVQACALQQDIQELPAGDLTELGERGINLSGGQKARVALARACYSQANVQLLDDPLSAVDPRVGRILFDKAIGPKGVMQGSTRVLVTHQRQYLPQCDRVLVLRNGRALALGTWAEVSALQLRELVAGQVKMEINGEVVGDLTVDELAGPADATANDAAPASISDDSMAGGNHNNRDGVSDAKIIIEIGEVVADPMDPNASGGSTAAIASAASATAPATVAAAPALLNLDPNMNICSGDTTNNNQLHAPVSTPASEQDQPPQPPQPTSPATSPAADAPDLKPRFSWARPGSLSKFRLSGRRTFKWISHTMASLPVTRTGTFANAREVAGPLSPGIDGAIMSPGADDLERRPTWLRSRLSWFSQHGRSFGLGLPRTGSGKVAAAKQDAAAAVGQLVQAEGRETGTIPWRVWVKYVLHIGPVSSSVLVITLIGGQAVALAADWWLSLWSRSQDQNDIKWLWVYGMLTAIVVVLSFTRALLFFETTVAASTSIHNIMADKVLHAPLAFFHTNPAGRILNRFSKDLGQVDDLLPWTLFDSLQSGFQVFSAFVLVSVAVPVILPVFVPLAVFFWWLRQRYVCTSREVKRWEAVTRSPVFAFFSATLKGLPTIRAYSAQSRFQEKFLQALHTNGIWFFSFISSARWIGFRLDVISALTLLAAGVLAMAMRHSTSPNILGLALTYVLQLTGLMQWLVRQSAEVENNMTSMERMLEYTELPQEPQGTAAPPAGWPRSGAIKYVNVMATYRPGLPPVLRNLNFELHGGTSCGVVGRTGSGKSSLMLTLFRLIDINQGAIYLDGLDTSTISLSALRAQLAIIPQDPVLFSGTLRSNLDPWDRHNDAQLWEVLTAVKLKVAIESAGGLHTRMAEAGDNLSVGQRQLFCLARALLQNARVLALDEATANVDRATDALIQSALRDFAHQDAAEAGRVLLVIAHRIDTILDCDSLLVLSSGELVEHGTPSELAMKPGGVFSQMVAAAKAAAAGQPHGDH